MKAIVHIGTEKTGTTSIQGYLHKNRRKLRAAGYHFIQSAGKKNNRAIPSICLDPERKDDFFRERGMFTLEAREAFRTQFVNEFERELSSLARGIHTVVISSEHFHSRIRSDTELDRVQAFLSQYFDDIRLICYLREQVTTCTSWFSTQLKSGGTSSFREFMQRCNPQSHYFNYFDMLAKWESRFGPQAMNVALFDRKHFLNGDLLDDFTARIDPGLVGELNTNIQVENESLSPGGQALLLAVNKAFPINAERQALNELRSRSLELISGNLRGKGQQLSATLQREIFDSFAESNEALRQKYFPAIETIFDPPSAPPTHGFEMDETFVRTLIAVLGILRDSELARSDPRVYSTACAEIIASIIDTLAADSTEDRPTKTVSLGEDEARLMRRAALQTEHLDREAALFLLELACEIEPSLPGVRARIDKYRERQESGKPQSQFMLAYMTPPGTEQDSASPQLGPRLKEWLKTLELAGGTALQTFAASQRLSSDKPAGSEPPQLSGFTLIYASSMAEALALAQGCPLVELGVTVEVSELNPLFMVRKKERPAGARTKTTVARDPAEAVQASSRTSSEDRA